MARGHDQGWSLWAALRKILWLTCAVPVASPPSGPHVMKSEPRLSAWLCGKYAGEPDEIALA